MLSSPYGVSWRSALSPHEDSLCHERLERREKKRSSSNWRTSAQYKLRPDFQLWLEFAQLSYCFSLPQHGLELALRVLGRYLGGYLGCPKPEMQTEADTISQATTKHVPCELQVAEQ